MSQQTGAVGGGDSPQRRPQPRPQPQGSFFGPIIAFVLVLVLIGAGLGAGGVLGWQWYNRTHNQPISVDYPTHPKYVTKDGSIMLNGDLPDSSSIGTNVDKQYTDTINQNKQMAFKALTDPVDITFNDGKQDISDQVKADTVTVTLKYDPTLIPKGLTSLQVGMAVYDQHLQSWVPILNAKADPKTNTVTARAPHFSWFSAIVLDPAKSLIKVAGQAVQTTIDSFTTVASWLTQAVAKVTAMLVNDLTGTPPELKCDKTSKDVSVSLTSPFDKLKGCVETAAPVDRVRISNGFAFPMVSDKLPKGMTLTMDDVWNNGANLQDAVRSLYWTNQNRMYLSGASISTATATADLQKQTTMTIDIDSDALAFDMGIATLSVMAPEATATKAAVKTVLEKIVSGATVSRKTIEQASSWVAQTYDLSDCTMAAAHNIDQPYDDAGINAAAGVAHDCLGNIFGAIDLKGALADLLSNLKLIPGMIQGTLYTTSAALLDQLPSQFDSIKVKTPTATFTRNGATAQPSTGKDNSTTTAPATSGGNWGNYKSLIGTWKAGDMTIVIGNDATGTFTWSPAACPNDRDSGTFTWCTIKGGLGFLPSAKSTVSFTTQTAVSNKDGHAITLLPEVNQRIQSFGGYVTLAGDKHSVIIEMPAHPGSSIEYCDSYMLKYSSDPNSPNWARCDGNAR